MITQTDDRTALCYMRIDQDGWFMANPATTTELKELIGQAEAEIVYPIFPTVFTPIIEEKAYYDAISDNVKEGDKVLVVCCGSGVDAWVASLKSKNKIYAIDINEQALLNLFAVANIGGFEVRPVQGDMRDMELPEDFKDFDFIFGNIPFLDWHIPLEQNNYHDGDDGSIITAFMKLLPTLLKKKGKAIIAGTEATEKYINCPMKKADYEEYIVYTLTDLNG